MTTAYAPDLAPDLEPEVVHWQPTHAIGGGRAHLFTANGAALALVAFGALALGAVAIGALAVGRLDVGRGRFRVLDIDELNVGRLRLKRRPF